MPPPIAVFTDTWWWNLTSIALSTWLGVHYAEYRQKRLGWPTAPLEPERIQRERRVPDGQVYAPEDHSLEQIGIDRKAWRRRTAARPSSSREQSSDAEAVAMIAGGLAASAALALGYLYARDVVQPLIVAMAAAAVGFVIGIARGLRQRGLLSAEWRLLLAVGGVIVAAALAVVWLLRNPLWGGHDTEFLLAVLDAGGPQTVFRDGGWSGRMFFGAQAVAVLLSLIGVWTLVKHYVGFTLEVNHRLGLPLSRSGRMLLRFERRSALTAWGGVGRSLFAVVFAILMAAGGPSALIRHAQGQPILGTDETDTLAPHFAIVPDIDGRKIVLRLFASERVRLRLAIRRGSRGPLRRARGVPRRLRAVETSVTIRPPGGGPWRRGIYSIFAAVTDPAGNESTERRMVRLTE